LNSGLLDGMVAKRSIGKQRTLTLALGAIGVACGGRTELDATLTHSGTECPGTAGPAMVRLPEGYCIDSTEVTRAQYRVWLDTNPSTAGQLSVCATNTTFTPESNCMVRACQTGCGDHPQVCVDWCDAVAYCKAVGKRLCGKIGGGTLAGYGNEFADVSLSQWFNACTSHVPRSFTYGNTYVVGTCNDYEFGANATIPVANLAACQSPEPRYSGVYDLTGNVQEWEDACSDASYCRIRGGDYGTLGDTGTVCNADTRTARTSASQFTGFRCCS
jgi:formylglycine-generating enzyme